MMMHSNNNNNSCGSLLSRWVGMSCLGSAVCGRSLVQMQWVVVSCCATTSQAVHHKIRLTRMRHLQLQTYSSIRLHGTPTDAAEVTLHSAQRCAVSVSVCLAEVPGSKKHPRIVSTQCTSRLHAVHITHSYLNCTCCHSCPVCSCWQQMLPLMLNKAAVLVAAHVIGLTHARQVSFEQPEPAWQ